MSKVTKTTGVVLSAVALVGGAMAAGVPAPAEAVPANAIEVASSHDAAVPEAAAPVNVVQGSFSFTQDTTTDMGVFAKASAVQCTSLPEYGIRDSVTAVMISNVAANIQATVEEVTSGDDLVLRVLGCACSTNAPGGGAIANAEVGGVPLAAIAQAVGA